MKKIWLGLLLILLLVGLWQAQQYFSLFAEPYEAGKKSLTQTETEEIDNQKELVPVPYALEPYVTNLRVPWSIVFTSPERMLISERVGSVREAINGDVTEQELVSFPEVSASDEEGLMGLVLDPQYQQNQYVYACLAYRSDDLYAKVVRLIDQSDQLVVDQTILESIPAARFHAGCRLSFGPDQKLYISTGDATDKNIAQDLASLGGKILRINSDGSIPADNPFPNSPVYSYGHRNPQGLAWDPITDQLWSSEHGPSVFDGPAGGDEINLIASGGNYGWPLVSHENNQEGLLAPKLLFTPAVAPGSASFYTGTVFPQFSNNLFFGALRGEGLFSLELSEDRQDIASYEKLAGIEVGRVRDVVTGPDGYIYFSSSNRDGRGEPKADDDTIYRLVPKQ